MYEAYWQLNEKPFESGTDPRFYFPGESHQAALLKLRYAIENRRGGALLSGPAGSGKTLLAQLLRDMSHDSLRPMVHLVFPQMSTAELLGYLAGELDGGPPESAGVQHSVRRVEQFLAENAQRGQHAVIVVDEAHLIDEHATLEALRLLMNFQVQNQPALTLLLVGQPGILPTLQRTPQLEERLAVKCLLRPFTLSETAEYVAHRLKTAGATQSIIPNEAMSTLHELTHGIARRINRLCDLALLIGFAEERKMLSAAHFEAVADELVAVKPE
ncbi:MAG: ExeA family protein [Planctomycetota bacterium]